MTSDDIPEQIPVASVNGRFQGTLFLRYYISGRAVGRTVACVKEVDNDVLITPREAESKAGMSTRKNWKKSLMTVWMDCEISMKEFLEEIEKSSPQLRWTSPDDSDNDSTEAAAASALLTLGLVEVPEVLLFGD